jgi:hypothetical protein
MGMGCLNVLIQPPEPARRDLELANKAAIGSNRMQIMDKISVLDRPAAQTLIAQNRINDIELVYKQYFFEGWQASEGHSSLDEMRVRLLDAKDGVGLLVRFCPYLLDF